MNAASPDIDVLERLLQNRRSCRAFLDRPVPEETVARLLQCAQLTASWCNTQPWQTIVTRGAATHAFREAYLAELDDGQTATDLPFPREYAGVYLQRRRECGMQLYSSLGIGRTDQAAKERQARRNFEFFDAPHVMIVTCDEALGVYGAVDCGAYVGQLLLAAEALGLGAIAQAALASRSPFVRRHFGLDDRRLVVCGVSFGYADPQHRANSFRTSRAAAAQAVTSYESWPSSAKCLP
jgi:nitroreductase